MWRRTLFDLLEGFNSDSFVTPVRFVYGYAEWSAMFLDVVRRPLCQGRDDACLVDDIPEPKMNNYQPRSDPASQMKLTH